MAQLLSEIEWSEPLLAPDMAPARLKGKPEPIQTYHAENNNA